ncbi:hypothetical protein JW835_06925 [bacterium]|nr:hypothetical protein [bacterium]
MKKQQEKEASKTVKVSVRAGFGSKLSTQLPLNSLQNTSVSDLAKVVVKEHIKSPDISAQKAAESLNDILQDPFSDIDMRMHTQNEVIPVSSDVEHEKIRNLINEKKLHSDDIMEFELAASRMARGGHDQ